MAWVVQKVNNASHQINHYPVNSIVCSIYLFICFVNNYPLNSNKLLVGPCVMFNSGSNLAQM